MADESGYRTIAAVRRPAEDSDYGTEATGITNQIPLVSEGMTNPPINARSEAVVGLATTQDVETVGFNPAGTISTELWYEGLEYLLFAALGFESPDQPATRNPALQDQGGSPAPNDASPESFLHIFEADENLHREAWNSGERAASIPGGDYEWSAGDQKVRSVSYCHDKRVGSPSVEHFVDAMVDAMTIKGAANSKTPIAVNFDMVARSKSFTGSSASWALPSYAGPRPAFFQQVKFYATAPGNTLATEVPIAEFELKVSNNLKRDDYDTGGNDLSSGLSYRAEPVREAPRKTTLKVKLARMNADTVVLRDWYEADTAIQCMLVITGPDISGSVYPFRYRIALPKVKILSANFPVAGPGVITGDAELEAVKPTSTNYGYTWVTDLFGGIHRKKMNEIVVALTNTRGSCFSRDANTTYPLP